MPRGRRAGYVDPDMQNIASYLQQYAAIWDSRDKAYHNITIKCTQFEKLANDCGMEVSEVKKKYKTLRTEFRKVNNKSSICSGNDTANVINTRYLRICRSLS